MGTFIEEAIKESSSHKYEDVVIQGQILDAKDNIKMAIRDKKNSATWYYSHDSYENYTFPESALSFDGYMNSDLSGGEFNNYARDVVHYLYNRVYQYKAGGPGEPSSFDYAYVEKNVKAELIKLGCKRVDVFIGPKTVSVSRPVSSKKNFLTGKTTWTYQNVNTNVIKWIISVSW